MADTIRTCRICLESPRKLPLPHAPRPILRLSNKARLVIASQAPGIRAHVSGTPFDDPSGERLRAWMGIGPDLFYDETRVSIVPMGFCFPGHDASKGDLPPRVECRAAWHDAVFARMPQVETILVIGLYALRYHLARLHPDIAPSLGLTEQVKAWRALFERPGLPRLIALPHPSWRNSGWLKRHPWFEVEVLPVVRAEVARLVGTDAVG
ncbi:uracil-DNA glycosylase family protein [Lichenihabitans psoromatis]|uniref:uracil-DNA glycosylase family protein n=1 Tax=Lichenihabitans psoromatis TaxID=2528642 RepID=UPI001FE155D2|nr:uracil-DNA glycosylase family protein [Lichenihabitans psoromatis]